MPKELIFDLETQFLFDEVEARQIDKLKVSILSTYQRELDDQGNELHGKIVSYWENEIDNLWKPLQEADRVIGFNTLNFDVPVLQPYAYFDLRSLNHFDILDEVKNQLGFRISLANLATHTLDASKTDSGLNAVKYWRLGDAESLAKLKTYCEADVIITKDLYDFGRKNGFLKWKDRWNEIKTLPIDFSNQPKEELTERQIGLF